MILKRIRKMVESKVAPVRLAPGGGADISPGRARRDQPGVAAAVDVVPDRVRGARPPPGPVVEREDIYGMDNPARANASAKISQPHSSCDVGIGASP